MPMFKTEGISKGLQARLIHLLYRILKGYVCAISTGLLCRPRPMLMLAEIVKCECEVILIFA